MDYESLTDEQIRERLTEAGVPVGPIIDATRSVYIRKLRRLDGELPEVKVADEDEDYEDDVAEPAPVTPQRPKTAKQRQPVASVGSGDAGEVRQRRQQRKLDVPITKEVSESTGGGLVAFLVKAVIFIIIVLVIVYFVGLGGDEEPAKAISGSD